MATWWNPSDLVNTTLSNSNLTTQAVTGAGGVRSAHGVSTGKWYWETLFNAGASPGTGVANASAVLGTVWTTSLNAALAYNGSTYVNNIIQTGAGVPITTTGTTVCIALDMDAKLIWFRSGVAGNWNNSGIANPATGAGGLNITALGSPLFALVATNTTTMQMVADFGWSPFVGTPPAGFTRGLGPVLATATFVAAEQWIMPNADARLTQVVLEQWMTVGSVSPHAVMTQIALEQWTSVRNVVPVGPMISMVM